jgi:hypothetical protein
VPRSYAATEGSVRQLGLSVKLIVIIVLIEFRYRFQYNGSTRNPVAEEDLWKSIRLRHF